MNKQQLKPLNHCVYATNYHLVIVTKYRKPVISEEILGTLKRLIYERVDAWNGECMEVNGEPDHVHILLSLPPNVCISDFVNALKTGTSRQIRNRYAEHVNKFYWKPMFWSRSYCVVTCGGAPLDIVKQYVQNQKGA
jgi:putative transposase